MLGDNVYFSNSSPSIKISVTPQYTYRKGQKGEYQHQFIDKENNQMIFLHHVPYDPDVPKTNNYLEPEYWIFDSSPNIVEIDRFTQKNSGETWYVQDYVEQLSPVSCFLVRKQSTFTSMYDLFHILYYWSIPQYKCKGWMKTDPLSQEQQSYLKHFRRGFSKDLVLNTYVEE